MLQWPLRGFSRSPQELSVVLEGFQVILKRVPLTETPEVTDFEVLEEILIILILRGIHDLGGFLMDLEGLPQMLDAALMVIKRSEKSLRCPNGPCRGATGPYKGILSVTDRVPATLRDFQSSFMGSRGPQVISGAPQRYSKVLEGVLEVFCGVFNVPEIFFCAPVVLDGLFRILLDCSSGPWVVFSAPLCGSVILEF